MTPEIQMFIITEQKWAKRLYLYNIFRSVITNIQDVLQTSSKQTTPINRINIV